MEGGVIGLGLYRRITSRDLLGIRTMDKVPNAQSAECKRIYDILLQGFGHMEKMKNDSIAMRVYVG